MKAESITQLQEWLQADQLEKILRELLQTQSYSSALKERIVALSGRMKNLKKQESRGLISSEDAMLERNKIREALILILSEVEAPEEARRVHRKKKLVRMAPAGVYILVTAALIWWLFQPRKTFGIKADLWVERATFRYIEGPASFAQGNMASCVWQNFETVRLEGERLLLDETLDGDYEKQVDLSSAITLKADPDISGLGVRFGAARLEKLRLNSGAILTVSLPEEEERLFRMTIHQDEKLGADWTYQDSLILQTEQTQLEGAGDFPAFFYPAQLKLLPPRELAREFSLHSFPGTTTLDLTPDGRLTVESRDLYIAEPSFFKAVETVAVPAIVKGVVHIAEVDREPFQRIDLQESEGLNIIAEGKLALQELRLEEGAIALRISGRINRLETGANYELRNPNNLQWLWQNRRILLIALGVALAGLAAFLPEKIRERILLSLT